MIDISTFNYLVSYEIDINDKLILSHTLISINGDLSAECYYAECANNTVFSDIQDLIEDYEIGIYRILLGANCIGEKYLTDLGYEYDAWQEYEILFIKSQIF